MKSHIKFREIHPDDFDQIKKLHEELFPVRYSDSFYTDACQKRGINGGQLFTSIAVDSDNIIIGFIFAQFINTKECEHSDIFRRNSKATELCYILTLGLKTSHRRSKLGSKLVSHCVDYAKENLTCGALYLHVIHYNVAAIRFYEKNLFEYFEELCEFYLIDKVYYNAYLYVMYINDNHGPLMHTILHQARLLSARSVNALVGWVSSLLGVRSTTTVPRLANATEQSDSHTTVETESEAVVDDTGVNLQAGIV